MSVARPWTSGDVRAPLVEPAGGKYCCLKLLAEVEGEAPWSSRCGRLGSPEESMTRRQGGLGMRRRDGDNSQWPKKERGWHAPQYMEICMGQELGAYVGPERGRTCIRKDGF